MENQVMSDIPVFSFFPSLSLSLLLLVQHMGFEDERGNCLRPDDVHFGRLIKGQGGDLGAKGQMVFVFKKIKREPQLLFFNFRTGANEKQNVVKWHLDSSSFPTL